MTGKQSILLLVILFVAALASSMPYDLSSSASFDSICEAGTSAQPDTFDDTVEPGSAYADVVHMDYLKVRNLSSIVLSFFKHRNNDKNTSGRIQIFYLMSAILFKIAVFPFFLIFLAMWLDRYSLPVQRLLHYIHSKDGKKGGQL